MTERTIFHQNKIEIKARLQSILGKWLFSNEETLMTRVLRKLLRHDSAAVNDDLDLKHPEI